METAGTAQPSEDTLDLLLGDFFAAADRFFDEIRPAMEALADEFRRLLDAIAAAAVAWLAWALKMRPYELSDEEIEQLRRYALWFRLRGWHVSSRWCDWISAHAPPWLLPRRWAISSPWRKAIAIR